MLPVLQFEQIENWVLGNVKTAKLYTSSSREVIGNKAFSVYINENKFQPDFSQNHLLIVDNEENYSNNDFIVAKLNDSVSIFEFKQKNAITFLREAGKERYKRISNADQFIKFGVIVQQIINRK